MFREAVVRGASFLQAGGDAGALHFALEDAILAGLATLPIFVNHYIKTFTAAWDEYQVLENDPKQSQPLLAVINFLASPMPELVAQFSDELRAELTSLGVERDASAEGYAFPRGSCEI